MKYTKKLEYRTFYADESISFLNLKFENDVNMYGTQAKTFPLCSQEKFENDVNLIILRYTEEVLSHFGTKPLFCYMTVKRRE